MPASEMNLHLDVQPGMAFAGERAGLRISLDNGPSPTLLPALIEESDALIVELFSSSGELVASATGQDLVRRRGFGGEPIPMETMPAETLPPNERGTLEFDLLNFLPVIAPGYYHLSASLRYAPGRVDLTSPRVPFRLLSSRCLSADAVAGRVCIPCLYSLSRQESSGNTRALFNFGAGGGPNHGSLGRVSWPDTTGGDARIAVADFVSSDSIDPDLTRWLAWTGDGKLFLTQISSDDATASVTSQGFGFAAETIVGRPVQHAGSDFTIFVIGSSKGRGETLYRLDFDAAGSLISAVPIRVCDARPAPCALVPGVDGVIHLAAAAQFGFPVSWFAVASDGSSTVRTVASAADFARLLGREMPPSSIRILALNHHDDRVAAAVLVETVSPSLYLVQGGLSSAIEATGARSPALIPIDLPFLERGESIAAASLAHTSAVDPGSSEAIYHFMALRTSLGRVFAGNTNAELLPMEDVDADSPAAPILVSDLDGSVHIFCPSALHGLARTTIHTPPIF
jgi:hypothetical protein